MQKKLFFLFLALFTFLYFAGSETSLALTSTPTPDKSDPAASSSATPTAAQSLEDQVNALKDRIAQKVSQLKLVEKRGVIGTVTEVTDTQITINDLTNNTQFADVDELTKFASPSAKGTFGISDITKGEKIGILGLYNKDSQRILARFVDVLDLPVFHYETVTNIDKENYTITATNEKGETDKIEIQTSTKTLSYTKADGTIRSGFSKITEGERMILVGYPIDNNQNHLSADRMVLLPEVTPGNAAAPLTPQTSITPTSVIIPAK